MKSLSHVDRSYLILATLCLGITINAVAAIEVSTQDLNILVGSTASFKLIVNDIYPEEVIVHFDANHDGLVEVPVIVIPARSPPSEYDVAVHAVEAGHTVISANATSSINVSVGDAFVRVTNLHSDAIYTVSAVIGWIYFVAWSVSFYPQMYENWKRKSVVGLNFDFLALNLIGFFLYSLFNCCLYWVVSVENEYFARYPRGTNPVLMNDIVFALHAMAATIFTIGQCFVYERGNQTVSLTARIIMGIFALFLTISLILAITPVIEWLDFLYYCSYVKLSITLIKYVPQGYMNFKRKSTVGWSIGNIFLDFTGGMLSMLQMILNAHNYNDWASIFGDPTKFGLGLFSVIFDIFFIVQHYVLYRGAGYTQIGGENIPGNRELDDGDPTPDMVEGE